MLQKTWRRGSGLNLYWSWGTLTEPTVHWLSSLWIWESLQPKPQAWWHIVQKINGALKIMVQIWSTGGELCMIVNGISPITLLAQSPLSFSPHSSITMCKHNKIKIPLISEFHCLVNSSVIGGPQDFFEFSFPASYFQVFPGIVYLRWSHLSLLYNHGSLNVHLSCGPLRGD